MYYVIIMYYYYYNQPVNCYAAQCYILLLT